MTRRMDCYLKKKKNLEENSSVRVRFIDLFFVVFYIYVIFLKIK